MLNVKSEIFNPFKPKNEEGAGKFAKVAKNGALLDFVCQLVSHFSLILTVFCPQPLNKWIFFLDFFVSDAQGRDKM